MVAKLTIFSCLVAAVAAVAVPVHPATKITYAQAPVAKVAYAPTQVQYAQAPVHYAPAPVHYAPAPVHYAPAPAHYASAPVAKLAYAQPEAPAHYDFEYSVHDTHTGDIKQQKESRHGDAVQGSYSLVQPDGVHRIVDYTSDKEHGFNAIVRYEGHPTEAPHHVTKVLAAPVAKVAYAPAPVHYAAPVAKVAYAPAPVHYAPAPVHYAQAPAHYAQAPAHYAQAPAHYAPAHYTTAQYAPAPVAKVAYAAAPAAKVAYAANLGHVSFSSPAISYHH